jgi:hypothetical protein
MQDDVKNAGEPTVGLHGPPVEDVSGSVRTVGSTIRQNRGPDGRWRPRGTTLIRGLDAPGTEHTELLRDSVTGQMIRGQNHAVLHRDPFDGPVHYVSPDYSGAVHPDRKSHDGSYAAQAAINHRMTCPCTIMGA